MQDTLQTLQKIYNGEERDNTHRKFNARELLQCRGESLGQVRHALSRKT